MGSEAAIIAREAADWQLRLATMGEQGWEDFIVWLEASEAHGRAFDAVAASDRLLGEVRPAFVPTCLPGIRVQPARYGRSTSRRVTFGLIGTAAACLAVLAMPLLRAPASAPFTVETAPGEHRIVGLADGSRIAMNGATRLTLDHNHPRVAMLERGEASFTIRHDAADPFEVRSGAITLRDMGTRFDVVRSGPRLDVAVAEGAVTAQPGGEAVMLRAGQSLVVREDMRLMTRGDIALDAVDGWQRGRLAFASATMADVGAAFERQSGTRIAFASGLSQRPFSGTIALSGQPDRDLPHLAVLIGATAQQRGGVWTLTPVKAR